MTDIEDDEDTIAANLEVQEVSDQIFDRSSLDDVTAQGIATMLKIQETREKITRDPKSPFFMGYFRAVRVLYEDLKDSNIQSNVVADGLKIYLDAREG